MTGQELDQTIAAEWGRIATALGAALEAFEAELTPLLRALEASNDKRSQNGAIDAILALFDRHPAARAILRDGMTRSGVVVTKGGLERSGFLEQRVRYTSVPVLFGTSRNPTGASKPAESFGTERANNSFGIVEVSIPDDHRMGALEKPRWFKLQFRPDPEKHVVVLSVDLLDRARFIAEGRSRVAKLSRKEALLFVHGFNVTFEDAARRAAQIAYDLHYEGVPVMYSWPSEGSIPKYMIDSNNVDWAEPHFREFLQIVRDEFGVDTVHIIAHSMGTRLLAKLLASPAAGSPAAAGGRVRQAVFAAPDIDADVFRNLSEAFKGKAERVTLYASSGDRALAASQTFQKYARAGQSGLDLVVVPTVDTVDASAVPTEFLGHSYFGDEDSLLSDLFYVIRNGTPPAERSRLRKRDRHGDPYWEFRP